MNKVEFNYKMVGYGSYNVQMLNFQLHKEMLEHILLSTMAFFDTTPIGRIINRFSKDIDEVDLMIPTHIKGIIIF